MAYQFFVAIVEVFFEYVQIYFGLIFQPLVKKLETTFLKRLHNNPTKIESQHAKIMRLIFHFLMSYFLKNTDHSIKRDLQVLILFQGLPKNKIS